MELESRQLSSLPAAVGAHCSRMVPTCSGCVELSYVSSTPPGCPATHLQSPPGAGRRAPLLRRLPAVGVRPLPPLSGWSRAASLSICPVSLQPWEAGPSRLRGSGGGVWAGLAAQPGSLALWWPDRVKPVHPSLGFRTQGSCPALGPHLLPGTTSFGLCTSIEHRGSRRVR